MAARMGYKPSSTPTRGAHDSLLRDLKNAGVVGFTFHVDSRQNRPGWKGKNETELNSCAWSWRSVWPGPGHLLRLQRHRL